MIIKVIEDKISLDELRGLAKEYYIDMVKGVVDIEKGTIAFGGEYHVDANVEILKSGSKQIDVWGFNIYLDKSRDEWVEYISLINIRPEAGSKSMEVKDEAVREKMKKIIDSKIL